MRSIGIAAILALLAGTLPAQAQVTFDRSQLRGDAFQLKIDNFDRDGFVAFLQIGNKKAPIVPVGEPLILQDFGLLGGFLQVNSRPASFDLAGRMCERVDYVAPFGIPEVARRDDLLPDLRITDAWLQTEPSVKEVEAKAKAIKAWMKGRDLPGRKLDEKELDRLVKNYRDIGMNRVRPQCGGRWYPLPTLRVDLWRGCQKTITIRGKDGRYEWEGGGYGGCYGGYY